MYQCILVCVCVFASVLGVCQCVFAKKKVRSARGHQLASALTWSKTTETRANGCHHQHCCYCCCCYCFFYCCCHCNFFFADSPDCSHAGQSDPQGQPRARSFGIETINKSKVRLRRVFSMLAQEQEKNTTTMTMTTAMAL